MDANLFKQQLTQLIKTINSNINVSLTDEQQETILNHLNDINNILVNQKAVIQAVANKKAKLDNKVIVR